MGTKIVVRRRPPGWRWSVVVVEECLRSGDSPTWRKARADAKAAMIFAVLLPASVLLWAIDAVRNGR